jgi:hypothetical protein
MTAASRQIEMDPPPSTELDGIAVRLDVAPRLSRA